MKKTVFVFFAVLLLLSSGCVTSSLRWQAPPPGTKTSYGTPVEWELEGVNNGIYLFYYIPIICGHVRRPNRFDYQLFKHWIDEKHAIQLLHSRLKPLKAKSVEDISVSYKANGWPGLGIFWSRSFAAKGKAVKKSRK